MKHQRAALLHEAEEKKKAAALKVDPEEDVEVEEVDEIQVLIKNFHEFSNTGNFRFTTGSCYRTEINKYIIVILQYYRQSVD